MNPEQFKSWLRANGLALLVSRNVTSRDAADGSMAALVPARRALSWQLTDSNGSGVVRERNWLSFSPGEVRVCASCHGINSANQADSTTPVNKPQALLELLRFWKQKSVDIDGNGVADALTDGILGVRYLFGFRGVSLIADAVNLDNCTRCTIAEIETHLAELLP